MTPSTKKSILIGTTYIVVVSALFLCFDCPKVWKDDLYSHQYFTNMQCETIPPWFKTYLDDKGPDYCPVVVVVSTTANRLELKPHMVLHALKSISEGQTRPPDAAFIVVSEYSIANQKPYEIPSMIPHRHLLKSCRDYGPATKFLPALFTFRTRPCTRLVSFDDDMIYDPKTLEYFYQFDVHPEQHGFDNPPSSSIMAAWGILPDAQSKKLQYGVDPPVRVQSVLGVYSYQYQPKFFDLDHVVWPEKLRTLFFKDDDLWFACLAKTMNNTFFVVPGLDHQSQDDCPLGECLHYQSSNYQTIAQAVFHTDLCDPGKYLQWKDEYSP